MIVSKNKVVSIDYTLTDEKNNLIDSTAGGAPLDYLHGFENIIPGLEKALEGKARGERFSAHIPAAEAYGEREERLVMDIPRGSFHGIESLEAGMQFHTPTPDGERMFTITDVGEHTVTVDGNHPLAGLNLIFDVTVAGIREASEEELSHGHVHGHDDCGCGGCDSEGCNDADRGHGEGCGGCCGQQRHAD